MFPDSVPISARVHDTEVGTIVSMDAARCNQVLHQSCTGVMCMTKPKPDKKSPPIARGGFGACSRIVKQAQTLQTRHTLRSKGLAGAGSDSLAFRAASMAAL